MQQREPSRNSFSYSIHHRRSFDPAHYGRGFEAVEETDWRMFGMKILANVWSPIVWRHGIRSRDNFMRSDLCALDFDDGLSLTQARQNFCDMHHIIGTTRSHQQEKHGVVCDRFRVIIPWERPIENLDEYECNMEILQRKYDSDPQALDGARLFWPCTKLFSGSIDGHLMDVSKVPDNYVPRSERILKAAQYNVSAAETGTLSAWARNLLLNGAPKFKRNASFYGVAIELAHLGHSADAIFDIIRKSKISAGEPPVTDKEIMTTIYSAFKAYQRDLKLVAGERADGGKEKRAGVTEVSGASRHDQSNESRW